MCNRYLSPAEVDLEQFWQIGAHSGKPWRGGDVFPRAPGPFIRRARHEADYRQELVVGQWGLIPWFAQQARLPYSTNNARSEELASKASYKQPWVRGQRCIIPAWAFDEPCWETGKNVWWTFRRQDGAPWGLAGLWNVWVDKATGEEVESYTMLTINADSHPIMRRMHKPDPKLPPDQQDKRSVIAIGMADVDQWLTGTHQDAEVLLRAPSAAALQCMPAGLHGTPPLFYQP